MPETITGPLLAYCVFVAFLSGAAVGSFLHCAAYRVARNESFLTGRSRCPQCGHVLGPPDLVPVFSWLFLRGRCRYCGGAVPARYVLSELLFGFLTAACLLRFGFTAACVRNYVFLCGLFCLSLVDWETRLIPDGCLWIPLAAWVVTLPFAGLDAGEIGAHVLAALVYGGGVLALSLWMERRIHREAMGGGDIKLFALTGLFLGMTGTLFTVLGSCILGLLVSLYRRTGLREPFPFGPCIAAAAAGMLLWGEPLVQWYQRLSGL